MPSKNSVKDTTKKSTTKKPSTKKTVTQKVIDKNKVKINPVSEEKQNKSKAELLKQAEALSNIRKGLSKTQKVTIASLAGVAVATSVVVPLVCYVVNKNDTTIVESKPFNIAIYTNYTDTEDGQEVFNITPGTKVSELKPIVKDGYIFKGYYMDEECTQAYDPNHVLKESDKIYALLEAEPIVEFTTNTYFFVTGEEPIPLTINTGMTIEEVEQAYWEMLKEVFEITDLTWQQLKEMLIQEIQQQEGLKFIGLCKDELGTQYPASYKMKTTDTEIHLVFVEATYNLLVPFSDGYVITDTAGEPITSFGTVPHGETIKFKIRLKEGYFGANEVKVGDTILTATNEVYSYSVTSEAEISVSDAYLIEGQYNLNIGTGTEVMYYAENQTLEESLRANGYTQENTIGFYTDDTLTNYIDISNTTVSDDVTIYTIYGWSVSKGELIDALNPNHSLGVDRILITDFIIPANVTSIGDYAFSGCVALVNITIPDSVIRIGDSAFSNCSKLTHITIPDSVTSVGDFAFAYCKDLTTITIPSSVISIGSGAFLYCSSLRNITFEEGSKLTSIESSVFSGCKGLTSISIPEGVSYIKSKAFENCSNLTNLTIPNSVEEISEDNVFFNVGSKLQYNIKNGIKYLGNESNPYVVLMDTESTDITTATIEEGCKFIYYNAFFNCFDLTSITIPNSVTSIGNRAFAHCENLISINIPNSVINIGDGAFDGCKQLSNIIVEEGNEIYHSDGNCLIETATKTLLRGCINSIIPTDGSVTSIGSNAFAESDLTSITIPGSIMSIDDRAFYYCTKLTTIIILNGINNIGDQVFKGCWALSSITIPKSVVVIGGGSFDECTILTSITFEDPNGWYVRTNYSEDGVSQILTDSKHNVNLFKQYDSYYVWCKK